MSMVQYEMSETWPGAQKVGPRMPTESHIGPKKNKVLHPASEGTHPRGFKSVTLSATQTLGCGSPFVLLVHEPRSDKDSTKKPYDLESNNYSSSPITDEGSLLWLWQDKTLIRSHNSSRRAPTKSPSDGSKVCAEATRPRTWPVAC